MVIRVEGEVFNSRDGGFTSSKLSDDVAANKQDAIDGLSLTDLGAPASGDLVLLQDASDSNTLKTALFSEFAGGGGGGGDSWGDAVDADVVPDADGTRDLGATGTRFAEAYTDALDVTNNITVGGTVDGRDIATDGTKLDGVESGATADQTSAQIKAAYEGEADTNAFTDADHTKLDGIATAATANDTDGNLLDRANHTGTQAASTLTGTLADARVAESNVTQHQTALAITESQVSDLQAYLTAITKAQVEAVLTGEISTHTHAGGGGGSTVTHFQVEDDGSTGQLTTGSAADLAGMWGTPSLTDSDFSWDGSTGILTVLTAGILELNVKVTSYNNLNNRHELHVQLYKNGSTVLVEDAQYASRNNTQDEGSVYLPGFKDTAAVNDTYRLRVFDIGVAATIGASNVAGMSYISAKLYT